MVVPLTISCANCRYFFPGSRSGAVTPFEPDGGSTVGECRRHAPVTGLQGSTVVSGFPQVVASDWCGEYGRANG